MRRQFRTFAPEIEKKMFSDVIDVIIVCAIAVVGFFGLWMISTKVIKRICEKKEKEKSESEEKTTNFKS